MDFAIDYRKNEADNSGLIKNDGSGNDTSVCAKYTFNFETSYTILHQVINNLC